MLDWFVIFIQFLSLVVLLVRIWLADVVSVLGTVVMSVKIVLRMAAVILFDGVVDFANQLAMLDWSASSTEAFVLDHAALVAGIVTVTHNSRWVDCN